MIVPCQKKRSCILFLINARFIYPGLNNVARYQAIAIFIIKPIAQTAKRALARTRIAESKMRGKTAIKRAHASLKARKRTSEASFAKPSRCPTLTDIHKKRRSKERRLLILVEARRIELRSILRSCSGSTSLFRDRISEDVGSRTNVELPSPFFLFQSHTDYVL